jgi:hypothetical protein
MATLPTVSNPTFLHLGDSGGSDESHLGLPNLDDPHGANPHETGDLGGSDA